MYAMIEDHYRSHADNLVKRNIGTTGAYHLAEEVVQEAYTRACQYWESYEFAKDFNKWFNSILMNCLKTKIKEEQEHGAVSDEGPEVADVQSRAFNRIILEEVKERIDAQPDNIRFILMLYFFGENTTKDIAEIVPETHSNVRALISGFRKKLRDEFGGARLFE